MVNKIEKKEALLPSALLSRDMRLYMAGDHFDNIPLSCSKNDAHGSHVVCLL